MREQWSRNDIANRIDAFLCGLLKLVNLNKTLFDLYLGAFQAQTFGKRHSSNRHQQHLRFNTDCLTLRSFAAYANARLRLFQLLEFRINLRFDFAFAKRLL